MMLFQGSPFLAFVKVSKLWLSKHLFRSSKQTDKNSISQNCSYFISTGFYMGSRSWKLLLPLQEQLAQQQLLCFWEILAVSWASTRKISVVAVITLLQVCVIQGMQRHFSSDSRELTCLLFPALGIRAGMAAHSRRVWIEFQWRGGITFLWEKDACQEIERGSNMGERK